jgi:hypothetical protein
VIFRGAFHGEKHFQKVVRYILHTTAPWKSLPTTRGG